MSRITDTQIMNMSLDQLEVYTRNNPQEALYISSILGKVSLNCTDKFMKDRYGK